MFSHLSRGYGTWKGIAKLEKPESAISNGFSSEGLILPPINKERQHPYDATQHDHLYRVPQDDIQLPDVAQSESLPLPKTYSTKSGALLLYSEGCFVPGSRQLKKRPRLRKRKEKRLQTLKDLTNLVMAYKKNECDPLLLAHLWHKANSARDLQPGFSPQRYLGHLGYTTLDQDSWKRLAETGSLKTLGALEDDKLLPLLFKDHKFGDKLLRQRPQPYTTMSLPPVSPSNSMLGSFTFYKHGMSTGAASMVSMNTESHDDDDHLSAKTVGSFIESLSDRLVEVESQSGFKRNYESLSSKEKEDLLTQLLVDITLHNQGEVPRVSPGSTTEFPSVATTVADLSDTKSSKSLKSLSKSSVFSSVCSLPPIGLNEVAQHTDLGVSGDFEDQALTEEIPSDILSSSSFVSGLSEGDLTVGVDGINIEIRDNTFDLDSRHDSSSEKNNDVSLTSDGNTSEQMLIEALGIQDGDDTDDEFGDEIKSVKSLDYRSPSKSDSEESTSMTDDDATMMESVAHQENLDQDGSDGAGSDGSSDHDAGLIGVTVTDHNGHVETLDHDNTSFSDDVDDDGGGSGGLVDGVGDDGVDDGVDDGIDVGVGIDGGGVDDGGDVDGDVDGAVGVHSGVDDGVCSDNGHLGEEMSNQTELNAANEDPKTQHISLSNLQDEARLVVEQVLLRPQSGCLLSQDAQLASGLLMARMEELLGHVATDDIRVRSADPRKLRPLGYPRNSKMDKKPEKRHERTLKSAGPAVALRTSRNKTEETTLPCQDEKENQSEPSEEEKTCRETEDGALKEYNEKEIKLDDITLSADEVKEPVRQSPEITSSQRDVLTVKDLTTAEQQVFEEVKETDKTTEKKENVKKGTKGKKGIKIKKGNVTKGKRKNKSDLRPEKQTEPPKTHPFRAGLVPEQKPPKGLKPSEANTKRNDTDVSETKVMAAVEEEVEIQKPADISTDLQQTETCVDSETGEIEEHEETLLTPENSPSLSEVASTRDETPSSREELRSSREETPSPRVETPRVQVSPQAAVVQKAESPAREPSPVREPSPEVNVEVNERAQRANARTKQRAAAAEHRRQEVERKRREREEARRKSQEEEARLEQLRQEAEEEMGKRTEERRIQKQQEECERRRTEAGEKERARQERLIIERQRATREEWKRKKELLLSQRKFEEEMRMEREQIENQLEEERRREYEARIAHLEDEERERLMEERRIEEERIKKEIEEERVKREEERRCVLEERRRMEEEMAALQERQWARQLFLESLLKDYQNFLLEQRTTRAFTFSYFDVLPWAKDIWSDLKGTPTRSTRPTSLQTVREDEENEEEQAT